MLHREVGARPDVGVRLQGVVRTSDATTAAPTAITPETRARGPLAQRVMRLLGFGGRQPWQAAVLGQAERMFRDDASGGSSEGPRQAWLAARSLPTPNGAYRATVVPG